MPTPLGPSGQWDGSPQGGTSDRTWLEASNLWYTCALSLFFLFAVFVFSSNCELYQVSEEERLAVLLETHLPKFQRRHCFPTMLTCIFSLQNSTENYKTHKGPKGSWFIQCFYGFRRLFKSRFVCFFSMPRFRWSLVARRSAAALPQKTSLATAATCRKTPYTYQHKP